MGFTKTGRPVGRPSKGDRRKSTVRLPRDLSEALEAEARARGITFTELAEDVFSVHVLRHRPHSVGQVSAADSYCGDDLFTGSNQESLVA